MDRFFENSFPDYQSTDVPLVRDSCLVHPVIEKSATELLLLLESKINHKSSGDIDWDDVSVYTGTAGYALLYYKLFRRTKQERYLKECLRLASLAVSRGRKKDRVSFLCGDIGPLTVSALSEAAARRDSAASERIQQILSYLPAVLDINNRIPDELLYGRTGYLYALNLLRQELPIVKDRISDEVIRRVLTAILGSGRKTAAECGSKSPLFYFWHDSPYVGAAHGFCGIIYHLLLNDRLLDRNELDSLIRPTVDFLLSLRFPSGNIRSSCGKDADRLVHWCHGAPGLVYTLTEAFRVFGDSKYLNAALEAADVIWSRGLLKKGYGLCHGVSGNAYAFLNLYQSTGDEKHLYRAVKFAEFCTQYGKHAVRTPDSPYSLFEGLAGTIYFMFDILNPISAQFPGYQLDPNL